MMYIQTFENFKNWGSNELEKSLSKISSKYFDAKGEYEEEKTLQTKSEYLNAKSNYEDAKKVVSFLSELKRLNICDVYFVEYGGDYDFEYGIQKDNGDFTEDDLKQIKKLSAKFFKFKIPTNPGNKITVLGIIY